MFRNLVSRSNFLINPSQYGHGQLFPASQSSITQCCNCQVSRLMRTSVVDFLQKSQEDDEVLKGDKVLKLRLRSVRLDAVLKAGLNISRSKIEKCFYEDRIRVNGARPKKKSQVTDEGDEVDIVRGPSKMNPLFIDVNRVEILEVGESGEVKDDEDYESDSEDEAKDSKRIPVVLKRYKNLTIENYDTPWKGSPMG